MTLNLKIALRASAIAAAMLAASQANALDWGGYFRAGPGATSKDHARACYGLNGDGLKYRLGNECDFYGEFALSQGFKTDGVDYKATLMTNLYNPGTDSGSASVGINQMYFQGSGFDIAPGVTFWAGKRFYGRADVHIVDTFFTNLSGVGAGADGINIGAGKLNVAWFRDDGSAAGGASTTPANRVNVDLTDIGVNPGGKLRVLGTFTNGDFSGGKSGVGLTVQHNQDLGGNTSNVLWVQFAQGSAGLNGNVGNTTADSGVRGLRVVDSVNWQSGKFGGQALVLFQQDKDATGKKTTSATIGGRGTIGLTKNFKLVGELGYSQKKPDGAPTQNLTKLTIAPTLSPNTDFWTRPELRLYVTTAKWNDAANAAAGTGGVGGLGNKTSGTSYGAQVEWWF